MKTRHILILFFFIFGVVSCSSTPTVEVKEGWYPNLVDYEFVSEYAKLPKPEGVTIVDSRPKKRKYDKGHIPGAVSIPDSSFDKMAGMLPENKDELVIFYCGGVKCKLSHKSAFKAEKLGYTNLKVYAEGFPDWKKKGGLVGVSVEYLKSLMDKNEDIVVIDSRPKKRKYDKAHIPGAISIPDSQFDKHVDKLPADKSKALYFYCGGLKCKLSPNSAEKAKKLGYTNVKLVPEGFPAWKKAYGTGKPPAVKKGGESGSISVDSFQDFMKNAPDSIVVVDVRDPDEYRDGTIKGAINMPINKLEKEMEKLPKNKPIVFFCGTAGRAGEAYDMVQMFRPELEVYFLNAEVTLTGNGGYKLKALD